VLQNYESDVPLSLSSVYLLPVGREIYNWTEEHEPSHLLNTLTVQ